jgi:prophage tail gpP-like protein
VTNPDLDNCTLDIEFPGKTVQFEAWTSYTFDSDFLTPCDQFSFTVGDPLIPQGISGEIAHGLKVTLKVNGRPTCVGRIDEVERSVDRSGGTVLSITGRDLLGDVVDSCVDPRTRFTNQQSLIDVVSTVLSPFGLDSFYTDNVANRSLITGNQYGAKTNKVTVTKKGKVTKASGQVVKSAVQYQAKPHPHEGAYEFCERLAKREGQHIWMAADGSVVIGQPDFGQKPTFFINRLRGLAGGANNAVEGSVKFSRTEQPSMIVCQGKSGGGNFADTADTVIIVNELIARRADTNGLIDGVLDVINAYPHAYVMNQTDLSNAIIPSASTPYPIAKPLFLVDDESRNLDQLKNFARREMAIRQRTAITAQYEVAGHTQNGKTWAIDTIVSVADDVGNLHQPMWIEGVQFTKDRMGGTRTTIRCLVPYTLTF